MKTRLPAFDFQILNTFVALNKVTTFKYGLPILPSLKARKLTLKTVRNNSMMWLTVSMIQQ